VGIDVEDPAPARAVDDQPADDGTADRRNDSHEGDEGDQSCEAPLSGGPYEQRQHDRLDEAGPEALHQPKDDQAADVPRKAREQ
jgi:hypothetical protein